MNLDLQQSKNFSCFFLYSSFYLHANITGRVGDLTIKVQKESSDQKGEEVK